MNRELTLRDYLRVAWSGRWLILGLTVLAMVVGALLTVAKKPTYTATTRVYMGQATTISGVPVQTPLTNPTIAPSMLDNDAIQQEVAQKTGTTPAQVRSSVSLSTPRMAVGTSGNLPTILTITARTHRRALSIDIANAYLDAVVKVASAQYDQAHKTYLADATRTAGEVKSLMAETARWRQRVATTSGQDAQQAGTALSYAQQQLVDARKQASDDSVLLLKSEQIEAPKELSRSSSAKSSGTAPKRVQTIVLAGLVGLLLGLLVTFVWRGSPAARAAVGEPAA
ncbi:MAG: Wzz/FepE/Etk N-terminal domain-containing protein [Thermoleophilia bacterium]